MRLVRGFVEREGRFEFRVIRRDLERASALRIATGLDLQQFGRRIVGALCGPALDFLPLIPAQRMQRRVFRVCTAVAGNPVQLHDRHIQPVRVGVLDEQELLFDSVDFQFAQPLVAANAIVFMNHWTVVLEVGKLGQDGLGISSAPLAVLLGGAVREQMRLGDDRNPGLGKLETLFNVRDRQRQVRSLPKEVFPAFHGFDLDIQGSQALLQLLAPSRRVSREQDSP